MLTLGLWANSTWVGVPGLRETACGCDIVDSLIGETGRSLLEREQTELNIRKYSAKMYWHFRAGRCVSVDSCTVLYIVRKISEKGDTHFVEENFGGERSASKLNGANISSEKREEGWIEKNFFPEEFSVRTMEMLLWFFNNKVYFVDITYLLCEKFLWHTMQGSASSC